MTTVSLPIQLEQKADLEVYMVWYCSLGRKSMTMSQNDYDQSGNKSGGGRTVMCFKCG